MTTVVDPAPAAVAVVDPAAAVTVVRDPLAAYDGRVGSFTDEFAPEFELPPTTWAPVIVVKDEAP